MPLSENQKNKIKETIKHVLLKKLENYKPETTHMPFHYRLLGKDRMALFSFIHSLNTTFGTSIFEPVAEILASSNFQFVKRQFVIGNKMSQKAQMEIQAILNDIVSGARNPNKIEEIDRIRKVAQSGELIPIKVPKVDLMVQDHNGTVHLFDIKTAKPNISNFKDFKRTLLEWIAIYLANDPKANVHSYLAIPYNPYEPKPYERWTLKGILDLNYELKVAEEFWDFLYGKNVYLELLNCFEEVGIELRETLDSYFTKFK